MKRVIIAGAPQSGCDGYDTLLKTCMKLTELEYLDCSNNEEDMNQALPLARLIQNHKTLKTIIMGQNDLDEEQLTKVYSLLKFIIINHVFIT